MHPTAQIRVAGGLASVSGGTCQGVPAAGWPSDAISSAIEGRNGYLSQMQHNHRGLPPRRYWVSMVLHNFDCRAADGTTPASRFFRRSFPDLFESVLSQIDKLPMPRKRRQTLEASH
jgi:Family of unknown function (DUF6399)